LRQIKKFDHSISSISGASSPFSAKEPDISGGCVAVDTPKCICGAQMGPVWAARYKDMRLSAWYCHNCNAWAPITGRECLITRGQYDGLQRQDETLPNR